MNCSKPFLVLERLALLLLSLAASLEASSSTPISATGFVAPLTHRNSPKSPFYNPHSTREDIARENQWLSAERERHFTRQYDTGFIRPNGVAPVNPDMIMTYNIGTPPVTVHAFADTGSNLIWLQCKPCNVCFHQTTPLFDPKQSSTYKAISCISNDCLSIWRSTCDKSNPSMCLYNIRYADNSASRGIMSRDTFSFPGNSPSFNENILFGCGLTNVDTVDSGVAGIVGLENISSSLVGQIQNGSFFSYCKGDNPDGYIRFGSSALLKGNSILLYTDGFGRYQLPLGGLIVGDLGILNIPGRIFEMVPGDPSTGVIIDSGTPYTRLHPVAFDALVDQIKEEMTGHGEGYEAGGWALCYEGYMEPTVTLRSMPNIQLVFLDYILSLPVQNIWTERDDGGNVCLKIFRSQSRLTIIGSEQLKNYNVGFDLKNHLLYLEQEVC